MIPSRTREKIHAEWRLAKARFRKLLALLTRREYRQALRRRVAASVEHGAVPFGSDFRSVIDIGASRGQFALFAVQNFPQARIVSFEPLPGPRLALERVLGGRVEVKPLALGAEPGSATMNISRQDDSSSILEIGAAQQRNFPGTEAIDTLEVPVSTLDEALEEPPARPCLLKIDVQGLELEVLKGATKTLAAVDEALVECSFIELYEGQAMADEVVSFLLDAGLRLAGIHGLVKSASGEPIQADFHFRRVSV